jgi:hypothetical protein
VGTNYFTQPPDLPLREARRRKRALCHLDCDQPKNRFVLHGPFRLQFAVAPDRKRLGGLFGEQIEQFAHDPARFARFQTGRAREVRRQFIEV